MTDHHSPYITLDSVINQINLTGETILPTTPTATGEINVIETNTHAHLKDLIEEASADLRDTWFRDFVPFDETLTIYANSSGWNNWYRQNGDVVFDLSSLPYRDLLSISSITLDGTSINSSYYRLDTSEGYPARKIIFDRDNVTFPTSNTFSTSLVIVGTWGYHRNPNNMWVDSGLTASAIGNDSTTSITANAIGIQTYQFIKIDNEYLFVTSVGNNNTTLTVKRGVNGSTAASHSADAIIYTYKQTPSVVKYVRSMVIQAYQQRAGFDFDGLIKEFSLAVPKRWTVSGV